MKVFVVSMLFWGALLLAGPVAGQLAGRTSNLLPMFGGLAKGPELRKADEDFLASCDTNFPSRPEASRQFAARGWEHMAANDPTTAIKRFNQAWLLDSTNASAHWGFGAISGQRNQFDESLRFLTLSQRYDSANPRILVDVALAHLNRYDTRKQTADLDAAIANLQLFLSASLDAKIHAPAYAEAYLKLGAAYTLKQDYAAAWKYVDLANDTQPGVAQKQPWMRELKKQAPRKQ